VPFQDPVAGLAGQPQRLHGRLRRPVQPVEVPVGGGQADHGVDLLAADAGLVRQLPCLLVPLQGGAMAAHSLLGVAEGLQGPGFEEPVADLAGELEGLAGQLERPVVAAGVGVDGGEVAERVGLAARPMVGAVLRRELRETPGSEGPMGSPPGLQPCFVGRARLRTGVIRPIRA
jgi:hypothetical protein